MGLRLSENDAGVDACWRLTGQMGEKSKQKSDIGGDMSQIPQFGEGQGMLCQPPNGEHVPCQKIFGSCGACIRVSSISCDQGANHCRSARQLLRLNDGRNCSIQAAGTH